MLKNGESKEKGITMIALVVTIVVLIILAQVSVQLIFGESGLITKSKYTKFVNEYSEVEEAVKLNIVNSTIDKETQEKKYPIIGEKIIQIKDSLKEAIEKVNEEEISIETLNLYKIDLEKLNNNIKKEYVIDTDTERIYLLNGEKIGGSIYHMPEIESSQTTQKIKKYKITFDSNGGETETENREIEENNEYGDLPIPTKERYIFLGWYTEKEEGTKIEETDIITSDITLYAHWQDTLESYVQDGLIVLYDGIKNTRNGHSSDTNIWENLASTSINGNLKNFNNTEESGWTDNSLILDGDDDWVQMEYIHNSNMTIEIVAKPLDILTDDLIYTYIASYQYGGIGISIENGKNESRYYISGYKTLPSEETIKLNQIYSMSTAYDGSNVYFRENENTYQGTLSKAIEKPESSTVFGIGTNTKGTSDSVPSGESKFKMEVYSVRIYDKCLTDEQRKHNYEIDTLRFNLQGTSKLDELGYVKDGLVCIYDGENNTRYGHSQTATEWENLASTNYDGVLKNFNYTEQSGWTDNSLILDGDDDWVKMNHIYNSNMTIEIVAKPLDIFNDELLYSYIASYQYGGIGISIQDGINKSRYYVSGYKTLPSEKNIVLGQTYSMSTAFNENNIYFRENDKSYEGALTKKVEKPESSTIFAIGTNTSGSSQSLPDGESRFKFEVYSVRIYNKCLTEEQRKQNYEIDKKRFNLEKVEELKNPEYVKEGLVCLYDGEKNTKYGHSQMTTEWENLISTQYDGVLKNFSYNETSGWKSKSLILDGSNDWVKMANMHNSNMTIEIVAKPLQFKANKKQNYLANIQNGGISICKLATGYNASKTYISKYIDNPSSKQAEINKIYSMSTGYDGNNLYFRENEEIYTNTITGKIGKPESSTVFAIGTNPEGTSSALTSSEAILKMEVYSVRIYNRCLKQDEINYNYQMDKTRYGL